jgi:SNF2 family DNA or RNA helicase
VGQRIKHHEQAIATLRDKISDAVEEIKTMENEELMGEDDEKRVHTQVQMEHDMLRSRRRRLNRMIHRTNLLEQQRNGLETGTNFFSTQIEDNEEQNFEICPICMSNEANVITQCGHLFCRVCLIQCLQSNSKHQCPMCKATVNPNEAHEISLTVAPEDVSEDSELVGRYGSKLTKMLKIIGQIVKQEEKVVVCSQWTSLLCSIAHILKNRGFRVESVVGNTAKQNFAIRKFKNGEIDVLMLSLENSSTGLDLVEANHVIFSHALVGDDHIVKAMEEQAVARIHRTGQDKDVHVYWLVTRQTVEEQMYLQTRN